MKKIKSRITLLILIGTLFFAAYSTMGQEKTTSTDSSVKQEETKNQTSSDQTTSQEEPKKSSSESTLFDLFHLGGHFMWPLLVFSIIVIAVLLERLIIYSGQRFNIKKLAREILPYLKERDFDKAIQVLDKNKRSAAYDIFMKGIEALKKGNKECEKAIESATGIKIIYFEKNLNILSAMGNIAPLTGFLGTVSGMITAFKTIALSDNVTARLVAGGIYEALITTAFGLIIAIIATGANNIFVHKVDGFVNQIEEAADNMIEAACR